MLSIFFLLLFFLVKKAIANSYIAEGTADKLLNVNIRLAKKVGQNVILD